MPPEPYSDDPLSWTRVVFRELPDWPGYGVDTDGNVWSCIRRRSRYPYRIEENWHRLTPRATQDGHLQVALSGPGRVRWLLAHRLVLETFIGPCPPGMEACHSPDRDPANCRLNNIRWDTHISNMRDMIAHGTRRRGADIPTTRLTPGQVGEIRAALRAGGSIRGVAKRYGVTSSCIWAIRSARTWTYLADAAPCAKPVRAAIRGEQSHNAKLTAGAVTEIRERYAAGGISMSGLSREYGVCLSVIHSVIRRTSWAHV
jgi:hypothetical protein